MFLYVSISNLLKITAAYLVSNPKKIAAPKDLILIFFSFMPAAVIATKSAFYSILLYFAFLLLLSLRTNKDKNLITQLLEILVPFEIVLAFGLLTTPLERHIILLDFERQSNFYFLLLEISSYVIISLLSFFVSSKIMPIIYKYKKEKLTLNIGLILFFLYQIYFVYKYASPYFLETIITLLIIIFGLLTYAIIFTVSEKQELKFTMKQQQIEQEYMKRYVEEVNWQYQELKKFKHDYVNILSSLHSYIEENDMEKLKIFYETKLTTTQNNLNQIDAYFKDLTNIKLNELKSLLALKLILAKDKNIHVSVEIPDVIPDDLPIDSIILVRMLGIILDNSIEATTGVDASVIQIGLFNMEDTYLIVVKNTVTKNIQPLHILSTEGFSTKGDNRGLGLTILKELSDKEENLSLETTITNRNFIQKIQIKKGGS